MLKMSKSKYYFNKNIFRVGALLWLLLMSYGIYNEGWSIFQKTTEITCPKEKINCEVTLPNKSIITLNGAETFSINKHDQKILDLLNYGTLILLLICFILNHYLYNKGKIKKILKKMSDNINE